MFRSSYRYPARASLKADPTQRSVKELLSVGIQPRTFSLCRTDAPISDDIRRKIALFCNVEPECVIQNATASTLYEAPLLLEREGHGLGRVPRTRAFIAPSRDLCTEWKAMVGRIKGAHRAVKYCLCLGNMFSCTTLICPLPSRLTMRRPQTMPLWR